MKKNNQLEPSKKPKNKFAATIPAFASDSRRSKRGNKINRSPNRKVSITKTPIKL